jgi:hypothetical protein
VSASALEAALGGGPLPDLAGISDAALDEALRELGRRHGAAAAPLLRRLAEDAPDKGTRKGARRELYRLAQAGVTLPEATGAGARPLAGPLIRREPERATAAWISGIDGAGSRAAWIVFEGGHGGGMRLCSLILNDEVGILESAGGPVTRKRLDAEQRALRETQKLPWVAAPPERAAALVAEALALHAALGTAPPPEFARWRALFHPRPAPDPLLADAVPPVAVDRDAADQAVSLLELPELGGWFVDPASVREEAVALLEARDSRAGGRHRGPRGRAQLRAARPPALGAEARRDGAHLRRDGAARARGARPGVGRRLRGHGAPGGIGRPRPRARPPRTRGRGRGHAGPRAPGRREPDAGAAARVSAR